MRRIILSSLIVGISVIGFTGCSRTPSVEAKDGGTNAAEGRSAAFSLFRPTPLIIPEGTPLAVRLNQSVSTKINRPGEHFSATLASPIIVDGKTLLKSGTQVMGTVRESAPSGRLKGRAILTLALTSVDTEKRAIPITTTSRTSASGGHKKRNWAWIGGGSGTGALIGALAGGGAGAAIGAGSGAAAGLATAAFTGRQHVGIPAETLLTFRLRAPAAIRN